MHSNVCTLSRKSRMLLLLSTIVLIGFCGSRSTAKRTAVVQTASGPVQGLISTTVNSVKYAAFKGIPYAKPPLRRLRFKPPLDPDPWTDVYNATKDPHKCIQFAPDKMKIEGAEDCLYLNVATTLLNLAQPPTRLRAVMVWIYGGSFLLGSATLKKFPPDYLLEKDIVYVSLNYRGGPLGYMSLHHPNASGNAGLKDLVLGLKWVQKNIANFGGNPKNVTIMGGSSGSAAVGYLVLSNLTTGLFHGSISMSGVPINPWAFHTPAKALHQAHRLIEELGMNWTDPDTILEALYHVSAWELANATSYIAQNFAPFAPTIENEAFVTEPLLTECAVAKYLTGRFNKVPQIIGFEDQETVSFVGSPDVISEMIDQGIGAAQMYHMDVPESIMSAKQRLILNESFYDPSDFSYKELRKFINESSDLLYKSGIDQTQRFLAANNRNNPVYYYRITFYVDGPHYIGGNDSFPGAGHGDDITFIFYYSSMNYSTDPTSPVRRTINRMVTMWTNFAKYGNPTPDWVNESYPLNITWPDSGPSGIHLEIGNELSIGPRPITPDMAFVQNCSWPYLGEATGCDYNSSIIFSNASENYTAN